MSLSNIKDKIRELTAYIRKMTKPHSIQMTISISFTILSICSMAFLGVTLYRQFSNRAEAMTIESTGQLLNQTAINLEDYLRNMRRISDTMYYSVIKNKDLASDTMDEEMNLLYEANKDNLISIACYTGEGQLVAAVPVANEKSQVNIVKQQWFTDAVGQMENLHFSTPHVQNLFGDPSYRYYWVVSLSRAVELTSNGTSTLGVLLVDMNYSSIEQILKKANVGNSSEYVYLIDGKGEIIYHPRQKLIYTDLYQENNIEAAGYEDGSTEEIFQGEKRLVTVKTVSYTGWKIVSVVPMSSFDMGMTGTKYFVIMLVTVSMLAVILLNQLVSASIAMPLKKLNNSVKEWETVAADYTKVSLTPGADETQLNFAWYSKTESGKAATPVVHFGTDKDHLTAFTGKAAQVDDSLTDGVAYDYNHVTVTGLEANTTYYYTVEKNGVQSEVQEYKTGSFDSVKMLYVGAPQIGASKGQPQNGEALTADALCRKYHELNKLYFGPDMISDDQIALEWARIPHFFYNYYVFQYATGFSAAVAIANRILKEGAPAVADYKKFLSGGCSTDPISLLKIAGVDMSSPEPVNSALALFGELVDELAELL